MDYVRAVCVCTTTICLFFSTFYFRLIQCVLCCLHTYSLLRTETNDGSQQGVVGNTTMGNLTTVKRAAEVYAIKKGLTLEKVTSAALQTFMMETAGN